MEWHDLIFIPEEFVRREDQHVRSEDILISMANSRELVGKVAIVDGLPSSAVIGGFIAIVRPIGLDSKYMFMALRSPQIQTAFRRSSNQTTNIANLSLKGIGPIPVPVPPLEEQLRIVAKVDQLMAMCDEIEETQQKRRDTRLRLNKAALDKLVNAREPDEFQEHWQRIYENFDLLYDTP